MGVTENDPEPLRRDRSVLHTCFLRLLTPMGPLRADSGALLDFGWHVLEAAFEDNSKRRGCNRCGSIGHVSLRSLNVGISSSMPMVVAAVAEFHRRAPTLMSGRVRAQRRFLATGCNR